MADIDQILAGGSGAGSRYDFSTIADPVKSYFEGADFKAKNDLRNAFKDGVPTNADGSVDYGAMANTLYQKGAIEQGNSAANLDLLRQQLKFGQGQSAGIQSFEGGAPAQPQQPMVGPSTSRSGLVTVPGKRDTGGTAPDAAPQGTPQADNSPTVMKILAAQGIPNDQLGALSASVARQLGVDPTAPLDINDPQVRNVLGPAVARIKQMNLGQDNPDQGQPQPAPQQPLQQAQAQPQPPQAQPQGQPAPVTNAVTTTQAPQTPSRTDQAIAFYSGIMSDPRSPKQNVELAKSRLDAMQKNTELTPLQKEYSQAILQGYKGTMQDFAADSEAKKTGATEDAKLLATKYQTIVDAGTKAQQEIPQLEMLQGQMNDPNFYSGAGEKYNLLYKRLKSAVGIDPDAAVPQEFLRKATAAGVLASFGALKGLGPIRVAEMNLAKQAAAAPENSIPANKLLVEIQKRTYQRQGDIADMAQAYKEQNGSLDAGFDKKVTAYFRQHPIFNDAEIKDFHNAIGEAPAAATQGSVPQKFSSPSDVHAALASGKLKKGDTFLAPNGKTRIVP